MRNVLIILLFLGPLTLLAQANRYDISLGYGAYQAPNYKNAQSKDFFSSDFDYHISKKWSLSSGFMGSRFTYSEYSRTNIGPIDAKGYDSHVYLTTLYSFVATNKFNLQGGLGIGFFTQRLKYPYQPPSSGGGIGPQVRFSL